ncbi:unnamed protein product [Closterium sp. NIES-54]
MPAFCNRRTEIRVAPTGVVLGAALEVVEVVEVVAAMGVVTGVGSLVASVEAAVVVAVVGMEAVEMELGVEALEEARGTSSSFGARPSRRSSFVRGFFSVGGLGRPCWADLFRAGVDIFDLDYDVILASMYALSTCAEGDCYRCVRPDPGIEAAALGASDFVLPGTQALHTFTLDSGASPSLLSLHLYRSGWLTPPGAQSLPVPLLFSLVRRIRWSLPPLLATCARTGRHLATFTRQPGSSLYTLATEPTQVAASAQLSASGQEAPPCSCRLRSHQTLLWHHRLGHPSLPRLRGMHSRLLMFGLPRSLPPLPPSPAPPCLPCVEGRQRAAPHSLFPPTTAPLQIVHMDVWGPVRVTRQGRKHYFLLIVDGYTWYTTVFPLCSKGLDLPVLRLHSDKGGEFSSDLLRAFCRGQGILQPFTLPDSPQQNGIGGHGLVKEVARTSMIHAAAPHFLWPFAVRYAAHHLNLWPHVSLPETSPTLRWTGKVGDASVFWDVTFDESVPFYYLFPYRSAPLPPLAIFLAPGPPPVDPLPPQGLAPSSVSQENPPSGTVPCEVAVNSGAARGTTSWGVEPRGAEIGGAEPGGAEPGGAEPGGAEPGGAEPRGAEPEGAEPGGAEPEGAESGGAEPGGVELEGAEPGGAEFGGPAGVSPRLSSWPEPLSPQQLHEWLTRRTRLWSGAAAAGVSSGAGGPGGAGPTGPGGAGAAGAGGPGGAGAGGAGVGGAGAGAAGGTGAAGAGGATGVGAGGVGPGGASAGSGDTRRPRPYFVPLLQQVLGLPSSTGLPPPFLFPPPDQSQPLLQSTSPLPAPSPYTEQTGGLTERREPESHPASPVSTGRRVPCLRPLPIPGTHAMALRPSSIPLHVPLPAPPESSLPAVPDPESDCARAANPTASRLLATVVADPAFEPTAASALVAELVDFAGACRLDYATALDAESESESEFASPPFIGGECALGTDVLDDRQEDFECLTTTVPHFASLLLAPEGDPDPPDIPTPRSYAEAITVPPSRANIVDGMWIFRVKRPPGSPPAFKARYVARGISQRPGVDYFQTFSPTPKMTTLWAPCEWHDTLRTTLAALGFTPSTADPLLFLRTNTSLPPFYILLYVDDLVFATADTEALTLVKSKLQKRHTCTDLGELRSYLGLQITQNRAQCTIILTQSHMVHQVL